MSPRHHRFFIDARVDELRRGFVVEQRDPAPARVGRIARQLACAIAASMLLGAAHAQAAIPPSLDSAGTSIVAFADTNAVPSQSQIQSEQATLKQLYCSTTHTRAKSLQTRGPMCAPSAS